MGARQLRDHVDARDLVASTSWGVLRVTPPWGGLADIDGLVQQLSHWCQQPLVFQEAPSQRMEVEDDARVQCTVCDLRLAPVGTEVSMPIDLLRHSAPPLLLQGAAIRWPQLAFQVMVASLNEAAIKAAQIEEGGMMLLPHAFQMPWVVRMQSTDGLCALIGHMRLNAGLIDLVQQSHDTAHADQGELLDVDAWRVELARPVVLPLPVVMGWVPGIQSVPVDYSCDLDRPTEFGLSAVLHHVQRDVSVSGMVIPVMSGAALSVRTGNTVW
ncbi:MAG: hypothetical protein KGI91_06695 [Burkholderiales bacterium]|nr:hypothetical protein [Burkholderiales bacterium]